MKTINCHNHFHIGDCVETLHYLANVVEKNDIFFNFACDPNYHFQLNEMIRDYNDKTLSFVQEWAEKCEKEIPNVKQGLYDGGDHCKLIETFNNRKDLLYGVFPPSVCSSTHQESDILIGISPGGWGVETRKVKI